MLLTVLLLNNSGEQTQFYSRLTLRVGRLFWFVEIEF